MILYFPFLFQQDWINEYIRDQSLFIAWVEGQREFIWGYYRGGGQSSLREYWVGITENWLPMRRDHLNITEPLEDQVTFIVKY